MGFVEPLAGLYPCSGKSDKTLFCPNNDAKKGCTTTEHYRPYPIVGNIMNGPWGNLVGTVWDGVEPLELPTYHSVVSCAHTLISLTYKADGRTVLTDEKAFERCRGMDIKRSAVITTEIPR